MPRLLVLMLVFACGCTPAPGNGPAGSVADLSAPDIERGEVLSLACEACHTLASGEGALLGPNLYGIFGGAAASRDDFEYSDALRQSGIIWSADVLDEWLADPVSFVPGNNMVFAGYSNQVDRRDLIAFLLHKTSGALE